MLTKMIKLNTFKYVYFFFCLFSVLPLTSDFCARFSKIFLFWGYLLIFYDLYKKIKEKKICTMNIILFLFYLIVFLGAIINQSNIYANINLLLYCVIQTYLMSNGEFDEKYISKLSTVYIFLSIVHCFLSLLIFFSHYQNTLTFNGAISPFGVYEGRLFGAFSNPNVGSFISWLAIVFCFYELIDFSRKNKKKIVAYILIALLNFLVLSLGNSRSVMVMLFLTMVMYSFVILQNNYRINMIKVLISVLIGTISIYGTFQSNKILGNIRNSIYQINLTSINSIENSNKEMNESSSNNTQTSTSLTENVNSDNVNKSELNMGRDFSNQDTSNGRVDIWKLGSKISTSSVKNFLFGVGNNNIYDECLKINSNITPVYSNMHNVYLQILVGSGCYSLFLFLLYFFKLFKNFYLRVIKHKKIHYYKRSFFWLSIIFIFLISGLFDSNLIYFMNVFMTVSFWIIISFYNNILKLEENNEKNSISN